MCSSGMCGWEDYHGNCNFPVDKYVRAVYKHPICEIAECKEHDEYLKGDVYAQVRQNITDILGRSKLYDKRINKINKIRQRM